MGWQKLVKWYAMNDNEVVAESTETDPHKNAPSCPRCGKRTEYSEYISDQDRQGNEIWAWCWVCNDCVICTEDFG